MSFLIILQLHLASSFYFQITQSDPVLILPLKSLNISESSDHSIYLTQTSVRQEPVLLTASDSYSSPSPCNHSQDKWTCNSSHQDIYSYTTNSSNHYLSLPQSQNSSLILLTSLTSLPISWNLTIIQTQSLSCVQGCQGSCKAGRCYCKKSYIGNDCSTQVFYLNNSTNSKFKLKEFEYKFFRFSNQVDKCEVLKNKKKIEYFLSNEKINLNFSNLPTKLWNQRKVLIGENIEKFWIKNENFEYLGIWTEDKVKVVFNCTYVDDSGNKTQALVIMWVIICFTLFVVIVWLIVVFTRVFRSRFAKGSKAVPKKRFFDENGLKVVERSMDKEDVCVICLESFHKGNKMRELECSHRYHQFCIENWLQIHDYCCICKQNYTETQTQAK